MTDFEGMTPESWLCVDCGFNTGPGLFNRAELEKAIDVAKLAGRWTDEEGIPQRIDCQSEVYTVRAAIWKQAGMEPFGGCLCVGCLEKRLGRRLKPKDFKRDHPFNQMPGTARLLNRRGKGGPRL
jgi:hypothetical protein